MDDKLNNIRNQFDNLINKYTKPFVFSSIIIIFISTIVWIISIFVNGSFTASELGDFLGGYLGAILSILTVLLVFQTYHSQVEELKSQKDEIKLQRDAIETSRVYDFLYREIDSIILQINTFETNVKSLKSFYEGMESDMKNKDILNQNDQSYKNFESRFDDILANLFPFIRSIKSFFERIEFLLKDRKDRKDLINITTDKLPKNLLPLLKITNEYLMDLKANPNEVKFKNFEGSQTLELSMICNEIKRYFYNYEKLPKPTDPQ